MCYVATFKFTCKSIWSMKYLNTTIKTDCFKGYGKQQNLTFKREVAKLVYLLKLHT